MILVCNLLNYARRSANTAVTLFSYYPYVRQSCMGVGVDVCRLPKRRSVVLHSGRLSSVSLLVDYLISDIFRERASL